MALAWRRLKVGPFSLVKTSRRVLIHCFHFPFASGDGGGEAAAWATHCSGARMGGWILSSDPAPPYSPHVSRLVFLRSKNKRRFPSDLGCVWHRWVGYSSHLCAPCRMRSCSWHLKRATGSSCSVATSPSNTKLPTSTCASTSSTFVPTKCPSSPSASICPSPGSSLVCLPLPYYTRQIVERWSIEAWKLKLFDWCPCISIRNGVVESTLNFLQRFYIIRCHLNWRWASYKDDNMAKL